MEEQLEILLVELFISVVLHSVVSPAVLQEYFFFEIKLTSVVTQTMSSI